MFALPTRQLLLVGNFPGRSTTPGAVEGLRSRSGRAILAAEKWVSQPVCDRFRHLHLSF